MVNGTVGRPDPTTDLPAGIHDALVRSVAVNNGGSLTNDDHPIELGVGQCGAECGSDIGTVRHGNVPPTAVSFVTTVRPDTHITQAGNKNELTSHNSGISPEYLDENTLGLPQHYSPGAIAAAGLPHDANYVSGGQPTAVRWHRQPLTCEACLGTGRNCHFYQRACSYCAGSGRGVDLLGMGAL